MPNRFDVIVIGVGAMGSAACFHLARRGVRVLGIEQFDIAHDKGSSHGHSRMIRMAYYEHPDYVPLLRRAFALWRELEEASGERLLHITGGLYMGRADEDLVRGSLQSARQHQLPHELLDYTELARRFPQFRMPDDHVGVLEANAGFLVPERCIAAHVELARRAGAEIRCGERVISWNESSVTTALQTYSADRIIFCGGAWTDKLIRDLGMPLEVTRQVMGWVQPNRPESFALGRLPVWAIGRADGTLDYGFPMRDERGFKIGYHAHGPPIDPDQINREPHPGDEDTFRPLLRRVIPDANGPLLAMKICMYTNSPDRHFIIDRHPRDPNIILACGFSGHGFKFASVIGEILADLAMNNATKLPIDFLGLKRFA